MWLVISYTPKEKHENTVVLDEVMFLLSFLGTGFVTDISA